jgi:hypothetical protein
MLYQEMVCPPAAAPSRPPRYTPEEAVEELAKQIDRSPEYLRKVLIRCRRELAKRTGKKPEDLYPVPQGSR